MERAEQLAFCKNCKNRFFERNQGIICSITNAKADFIGECKDYVEDVYQTEKYGTSPYKTNSVDNKAVNGTTRFANYIIDRILIFGLNIGVIVLIAQYDPFFILNMGKVEEYLIGGLFFVVYYIVLESTTQASIGKLITGTKVVNMKGEKPSFGQIIGRSFARLIPFEAFSFLGSGAIGWHDTMTKTRVVKKTEFVNSENSEVLDADFENEFA